MSQSPAALTLFLLNPVPWFESLDPLTAALLTLLAAAVLLFAGMRLLWSALPFVGLWRGAAMGVPVVGMALFLTTRSPGGGIALLMAASVMVTTLGLGVSAVDLPEGMTPSASPLLRLLLPLTATVCLVGFHGEVSLPIAAAVLVVGVLSLWTAAESPQPCAERGRGAFGVPAAVLLVGGGVLLVAATRRVQHASGAGSLTPVLVLLTGPTMVLAMIGLLAAEARRHRAESPQETVVGFVLACLGLGLPAVALLGNLWPRPAEAATQAFSMAKVLMPLGTWRIDSVLLLAVSAWLLPVGNGRFRVGRLEGAALTLVYLAYAAVATRVGARFG